MPGTNTGVTASHAVGRASNAPSVVRGPNGEPLYVVRRLGAGGMGEVLMVERRRGNGFSRRFALKRLLPAMRDRPECYEQRMLDEGNIGGLMTHPSVCRVYDAWVRDSDCCLLMEYIDGPSFLELITASSRSPMDVRVAAALAVQVCSALQHAHELRDRDGVPFEIVHRDVTPTNLLVDAYGAAKLIDFGVAKMRGARCESRPGTRKGKWSYMAPEQIRGDVVDRRADIFGFGVVLYELLTGCRLFKRSNDFLNMRAVLDDAARPLMSLRPDIPRALSEVVERAIAKRPEERFATARELERAIVRAVGPLGIAHSREVIACVFGSASGDTEGAGSGEVAGGDWPTVVDDTRPTLSSWDTAPTLTPSRAARRIRRFQTV